MKLYATTTSERASRPAKKGGNEYIRTLIEYKGAPMYDIYIENDGEDAPKLSITNKNGVVLFEN